MANGCISRFMAALLQVGSFHLFSYRKPCETEGCEEETNATIWNGERWRHTCEEHQSGFQDELRRKGLRDQ